MKKIVMVLFVCFVVPAFATEMCARNDAVVVPLDAAPNGTGYGSNGTEHIWWTDFSYGRIYGLATCLSAAEGGKPTGSMGSIINAAGQMLPADDSLGGRTGQDADGNDRTYCWCKMTHPASSRWVFRTSDSFSDCTSNCATYCGNYAQSAPLCGLGCSGRSANDVPGSHGKNLFLAWVARHCRAGKTAPSSHMVCGAMAREKHRTG